MLNLQPYADPKYFVYLLLALAPLAIGLYFGKRFVWYEIAVSLVFIVLMFDGAKYHEGFAIIEYMIWQWLLVWGYTKYRQKANRSSVFYVVTGLAILPLFLVKLAPATHWTHVSTLLGFMGISYLTFRSVGMILETRDGSIKNFDPLLFLRFMLFMPSISSGPIDRYRRFEKDVATVPTREKYLELLEKAVWYFFLGFLYKFVLAYIFGTLILPQVESLALAAGSIHHGWTWWLIPVMYAYGLDLFFDFAGYSLFAVATSYVMGVSLPMNFNKPFLSKNLKEFWNRWHMTLSFWFRDYIYMRLMFFLMKKKVFKSRIVTSNIGYFALFLIMGIWHGLTWFYIAYGLYHATLICVTDAWLRFKKKHKDKIPSNKFTHAFAVFLTFQAVCVSFLIFSGFLDKLWFK